MTRPDFIAELRCVVCGETKGVNGNVVLQEDLDKLAEFYVWWAEHMVTRHRANQPNQLIIFPQADYDQEGGHTE